MTATAARRPATDSANRAPASGTPVAPDATPKTATTAEVAAVQGYGPWARRMLAVLRISFGFYFLWAFLDKTFGWGFATPAERAWINGGNPTAGYLGGAEGTFASFFQSLAGQAWVSPLFMMGLLGIGLALTFGIGMRITAVAGATLYMMMYAASLPLVTNPILDDHLLGALTLIVLALTLAGDTWGLGAKWARTGLVTRFGALR